MVDGEMLTLQFSCGQNPSDPDQVVWPLVAICGWDNYTLKMASPRSVRSTRETNHRNIRPSNFIVARGNGRT